MLALRERRVAAAVLVAKEVWRSVEVVDELAVEVELELAMGIPSSQTCSRSQEW